MKSNNILIKKKKKKKGQLITKEQKYISIKKESVRV